MTNDTPEIAALRARFEKWIGQAPFYYELDRYWGKESAWRGNYKDPAMQIAWEAFQAGATAPPAEPVPSEVMEAVKRRSSKAVVDDWQADTDLIIIADYAIATHTQLKGANDGK